MSQKRANNWPSYVYNNNGTVIFRPRIPKDKQDIIPTKSGFLSPPIKLGKITDSDLVILRAYLAAQERLGSIGASRTNTLLNLSNKYLSSKRFAKLKSATQEDYRLKLLKFLRFPITINDSPGSVSDLLVPNVTKPILRRLMDKMLEDYQSNGMSGLSVVNGQFRVFSAMLTYGIQYHDNIGLESNPCLGIELHRENKRDRYVTDEEYQIQYDYARQHGADYLPVFFEFAYLLASRSIEVTDLLQTSVTDEGIRVERRKGSKTNIIKWSPRLLAAHKESMRLNKLRKIDSPYLLPTTTGKKFTHSTIQSAMARLKKSMNKAGFGEIFWTLHDLKRKGISDAKNKNIGGHKTSSMKQRYDQEIERIEPPG